MKYTPSQTDSVRTPEIILEYVRERFGTFYDPCPLNPNPSKDALKLDWREEMKKENKHCIYINPPYSSAKQWILKSKLYSDLTMVYLIKNESLGSKYFRELGPCDMVFITPHLRFPNYFRNARFSNLLLITGPRVGQRLSFLHLN